MKLCFQSNLNAWSSKRAEAVPIKRVTNNNNSMLSIIQMPLILTLSLSATFIHLLCKAALIDTSTNSTLWAKYGKNLTGVTHVKVTFRLQPRYSKVSCAAPLGALNDVKKHINFHHF